MAIDLLAIQPHKVSTDLSGYVTYIFGPGGTGKTTLATQLDRALLLACERGYNALPGVIAQDITKWSEIKQVVKELQKPEVKETFKSIVIDTIDLASDYCEKYICNQNGVEKIGDIPWGGGYKLMKKEFESVFRSIAQMGYALFFISHAKDKVFKREDGSEYNQIVPSLAPSSNEIIRNMSDLQGYAHQTSIGDGEFNVMLTLRSMDGSVECKSRFKMMQPEVPFTYEALSEALNKAIEDEGKLHNGKYVTNEKRNFEVQPERSFAVVMTEVKGLVGDIQKAAGDSFKTDWAPAITEITNKYLGVGHKVTECTPEQVEQIELIIGDLKDLMANGI